MSSFAPLVLSASAGSGKTFRLTNRFIQLLLAGENPERILATTFTRKAAGEIRARVFSRLALSLADDKRLQALGQELGLKKLGRSDVLDVLEKLVRSQHRLGICTNDALLISIARSFSLELGLAPGWRIASNDQIAKNFDQIILKTLEKNSLDELVTLITALDSGTRKTRLLSKLRSVLSNSHRIFLNSDKSAWHWLEAEVSTSGPELKQLAQSITALPCPMTKAGAPQKRYTDAFETASQCLLAGDYEEFLGLTLVKAALDPDGTYYGQPLADELKSAFTDLARKVAPILLRRLADSTAASYKLLKSYDSHYQRALSSSGALTYDDVKSALSAMLESGGLDEMYYRLDSRYHHLLFDEFQDTSDAEWNALQPMVGEILSKASGEHSFFCVGDPKQAIYGWRGGRVGIFGEIPRRWDVPVESMPQSRRSAKEVISFVNRIFGNIAQVGVLTEHTEAVHEWLQGFEPHDTVKSAQGYVRVEVVQSNPDDEALLTRAVGAVQEVLAQAPAASIGVLVRRNQSVAEFIKRFNALNLEVQASEEGGNPLTDSAAVRDVLALLLAIDSPAHSIHRFHALQSPIGRALALDPAIQKEQFLIHAAQLRAALLNNGYGQTIGDWVAKLRPYNTGRELRRLHALVELAFEFDQRRGLRPRDFVDFVEGERVEDAAASQVRVMTIHQSKGLEFDVVILPELEELIFKPGSDRFLVDELDDRGRPGRVLRKPASVLVDFDPRLKKLYEADQGRVLHDSLSALYVAITRPRTALIVLLPERSEKSKSKNLSGIVTQALGFESVELGVLLESGDACWFAPFSREVVRGKPSKPELRLSWAKSSALQELRREAAVRPSKARVFTSEAGLDRGIAVHSALEKIEWAPEGEPLLKSAEMRKLFSLQEQSTGGLSPRVYRELPFSFSHNGQLIAGRIDRVVIYEKNGIAAHAEVIDFKNEAVQAGQAHEAAEGYRLQLEPYRLAVSRICGLELAQVKGKIAFVPSGLVIELS